MRMNQPRRVVATAIATLLLVGGIGVSAVSASTSELTASYDGQTINLADGWDGAQACVVFSSTDIQCFDTAAEMHAAESLVSPVSSMIGASPLVSCGSGPLELFQNIDYGGSELDLDSPQGSWINIAALGFGDETSSWINYLSCDAYAAKTTNGTGSQLTMASDGDNSWIGSTWNDSINSVELG